MKLRKCPTSGIICNLDNANYFLVLESASTYGKHAVFALFGTNPGFMNESIEISKPFETRGKAEGWLSDFMRSYGSD